MASLIMYFIGIIFIVIYILLFKRAAGTLSLTKLNIISFSFYSILFFQLIGGTLVFWGIREHYLIEKITDMNTIPKTYFILIYTALMLPIVIILVNYLFFRNTTSLVYKRYIEKETMVFHSNKVFIIMLFLTLVGICALIYTFAYIGYIPILKYITRDINFAVERINIGRNFAGNEYIRNILMLFLIPLISYVAYVYMRLTNEIKWKLLFALVFVLSILTKTYDFSKAPVVYYLVYFYLLEVWMGKVKNIKKILPFIVIGGIVMLFFYRVISGYEGNILSLTSGPLSRIIMTQVATLFLHVDAFPLTVNYLQGHSFHRIFSFIFGPGEYGIRSGRVVMETYAKSSVANGTAGVMNTLFVGEAYANFGLAGVFFAPIIVGIIISVVHCVFIKSPKTPLTICLMLEIVILFTNSLQGGFTDFFYNVNLIISLLLFFIINLCIRLSASKGHR